MKEFDYIRLIDITKEYINDKNNYNYKYMTAYWDKMRKEKEKVVGHYNIDMYVVPNHPHAYWEVNE